MNRTPLVTRVQTCQTLLQESAFPLADIRRRAAYLLLHLRIARTICQQEQHPSDPRVHPRDRDGSKLVCQAPYVPLESTQRLSLA